MAVPSRRSFPRSYIYCMFCKIWWRWFRNRDWRFRLPGDYIEELKTSEEEPLKKLPASSSDVPEDVVRATRQGPPFLEILRYAKEVDADLIVMGTHGRSGLVQMLIGSVAEKIVRKAPCPVLTVRPDQHEFVMS